MTGWQTGHRGLAFDEGAFFSAIIRSLRMRGSIGRLYAWGFSNGAALAYQLAVNGEFGFRGIAASVTALTAYPETFTNGLPVPSGPSPALLAYNFPTLGSKTRHVTLLSIMASGDPNPL